MAQYVVTRLQCPQKAAALFAELLAALGNLVVDLAYRRLDSRIEWI